MRLKKRNHCRTRGPTQRRLIFKVKSHFSVRDEDSSEKQKRHLTQHTRRHVRIMDRYMCFLHTHMHSYLHCFQQTPYLHFGSTFNLVIFRFGELDPWNISRWLNKIILQVSKFINWNVLKIWRYRQCSWSIWWHIYISKRCNLLECNDPRTCSTWPWWGGFARAEPLGSLGPPQIFLNFP